MEINKKTERTLRACSYALLTANNGVVRIEATDIKDIPNSRWVVRQSGCWLSKYTGKFEYEPLNSSWTERVKAEHFFDTPQEAAVFIIDNLKL